MFTFDLVKSYADFYLPNATLLFPTLRLAIIEINNIMHKDLLGYEMPQ